jgi:quinol monooxygenase YgiN
MSDFAVVCALKIREGRVDEFLSAAEKFVLATRKEDGCRRFDLLRDAGDPTKFLMYLAHKDEEEYKKHVEQPHFKEYMNWTTLGVATADQALGPIEHHMAMICDSTSIGEWAFQDGLCNGTESGTAMLVSLTIRNGRKDDFLKVMKDDITKSRDQAVDPGCLRFDLMQAKEAPGIFPNTFLRYEVFKDKQAFDFHTSTDHHKSCADFEKNGVAVNPDNRQPLWSVSSLNTTSIPGGWALDSGL